MFVQLLQGVFRVYHCNWLNPVQKASVEACIKVLSDVGKKPGQHQHLVFWYYCSFGRSHVLKAIYETSVLFPQIQQRAEPSPSRWTWTVRLTTCLSNPITLCRRASSAGDSLPRTLPGETRAWLPPKITGTSLRDYRSGRLKWLIKAECLKERNQKWNKDIKENTE